MIGIKQGKAWGYTLEFFNNAIMSAHHITVNKGGFCSEHKHEHKHNTFYVLSGKLEVTICRESDWPDKDFLDRVEVTAGQSTAVAPGLFHMFRGLEPTEAIEVYQVMLTEPDIERRTEGGIEEE